MLNSSPASSSVPQRSVTERWRRRARYLYLKFIRLRGHPKELARGLAAGVFAGMFPLFGLQTIIGVAIALRIRGNPLLAAGGTWISNPLTYLPIYAFNYRIGRWLLRSSNESPFGDLETLKGLLETGADITTALMLGSFVTGLLFSLLTYLLGLPLIQQAQARYRRLRKAQRYRDRPSD